MRRKATILFYSLIWATFAVPALAQDAGSVQTVKELYAAAAYEEALALVNQLHSDRPEPEIEQYRAFCLLALGRSAEAHSAIQRLMEVDPLYMPDPAETSPRMQKAFTQARQALLPKVTKRIYTDAKGAFERKDRDRAIARFETLLRIIDTAAPAAESLSELRLLAAGFLDLSRAMPEVPAPVTLRASTPPLQPLAPTVAKPTTDADDDATGPVAIKQQLPAWVPVDAVSQLRGFVGAVRVHVGADGRVESAEMVRTVHPAYDGRLLRAAETWTYQPARAKGVAIPSDIVIQVVLRPR